MTQRTAVLIALASFASTLSCYAQPANSAPTTKRCVAIHSVNFKSGRMKEVNFKYRWCDPDGTGCQDNFSSYKLANEGSAFQVAILCYTSAADKKVRVVFDKSFSKGYQRRGYTLKPSDFSLTEFRRFRLPNTHCIHRGAYHFDFQGDGIQLYSGRPPNLAKKKCRWSLVHDISFQRCMWSGTSASGKLAHCSDAISHEQDEKRIAKAYAERGETYRKKGKYDRAIADFDSALELTPKYAWALGSRGQAYRQKGEFDQAIADLTKAIEINSKMNWLIANRGEAYRRKGEFAKAIADLTKAIERQPDLSWAIGSRGEAYRQLGEYDKAIADFDRAIAAKPKYAWALVRRGVAHRQKSEFKQAIADLERSLELNPDSSWAYANLGEAHRQSGAYDKAIVEFDKAIDKDPKYVWALVRRGEAYRDKDQFEQALKDFDRAVELSPKTAWPLDWRGRARYYEGQYQKAAGDLEQAIKLSTSAYTMLFHYLALKKSGAADAETVLAKNAERVAFGSWPHLITQLYLGKSDKQALLDAATDPTKKCEASYYIGEWYVLKDERQEAIENLKAAAATCPKDYIEYDGATAALKRLQP